MISETSQKEYSSKKDHILSILESQNDWVSGEYIAGIFGLSRMAVAKHIATLRNSGHVIESVSRRGYRLVLKADVLSVETITSHLQTDVFGKSDWRYLKDTDSTNKEAIIWAAEGAPEGSVVFSDHQSQGRGRKGRIWFSSPRALQFSIIMRPVIQREYIPFLMKIGALAVAEAIARVTSLSPQIKEPNDVLVNHSKVCGILIELGFQEYDLEWAVMGIGCNVNALREDFSEDLRMTASSLYIENGEPVVRSVLFACILKQLEKWYDVLMCGDVDTILQRWKVFL